MDFLRYVNIKQGSKSTDYYSNGNTLPLVQRPFAFASFAPQTNGSRGTWYYHPDDRCLEGIRLTHQPSPWIGEHGAFLFQPQAERPYADSSKARSAFDGKTFELKPHYLKYDLKRAFATIELTPTEYGGRVRLEFHKDMEKYFSVLPVSRDCSYAYDPANNRLLCSTTCNARQSNDEHEISAYFVFQFAEGAIDPQNSLVEDIKADKLEKGLSINGENTGIHLRVAAQKTEIRLATSFISYEQAMQNLKNDSDDSDFDELKEQNAALWNEWLHKIEITADENRMKTFYSCMYRAFLFPHKAYEIDADGNAVHYAPSTGKAEPGYRYTDNGFWDTYRTVYPFLSIVAPDKCAEFIEGFIQDYKDGGWLPCWSAGDAKKCMPSTGIDAVIADAAAKGILTGELLETALQGMEKHANHNATRKAYGRDGCEDYLQYGYVPRDRHKESVNLTLDAAYFDYCIAVVCDILGYEEKKEKYLKRGKNYANVFDKETGFMRGRDTAGNMKPDFDPIRWGEEYTEAAAWQTSFAVQHDMEGLAELLGGKEALVQKLDAFFAAPAEYRVGGYGVEIHEMAEMAARDWGQCAISNQPSFHIPFIYAYLGEEEKANYWLDKICREGFSWTDDGFPGDEDNGSMAIWYIFTMIGIYPICPGKAEYTKTKTFVEKVKILGKELDLSEYKGMIKHSELMKKIKE